MSVVKLVAEVLIGLFLPLFSFKAGRDNAKKKELESKVKDNERLNKIRRKNNKLSRNDKLKRLRDK